MRSKLLDEYKRRIQDLEWNLENQRRRAVRAEALVNDGHPFAVVILRGDEYQVYEKRRDLDFMPYDSARDARVHGKPFPVLLASFTNRNEATDYAATRQP